MCLGFVFLGLGFLVFRIFMVEGLSGDCFFFFFFWFLWCLSFRVFRVLVFKGWGSVKAGVLSGLKGV